MRFSYSVLENPPTLVVPLVLAPMDASVVQDVEGKIDTGCDITVIPARVARALDLKASQYVTCRGARDQRWEHVPLFRLRIRVAGENWMDVNVVEFSKDYALIGRDLLNRFILTANGPAGHFDLDLPPSTPPA